MKLHLSLVVVACFSTFALAQNPGNTRPADKPADAKANALDGMWTVVAIEKNGQPVQDAKDMTVSIKDNTITCNGKDGKQAMTVKFGFAGPGRAKVVMTDGGTTGATGTDRKDPGTDGKDGGKEGSKEAVYVLTNDYLAVCIHDDTNSTGAITTQPNTKSKCSILLKRSGTTK